MENFVHIKELVDRFEHGLSLPMLMLVRNGRDGGTEYLMKRRDRCYVYGNVVNDLHQLEEPTELKQILHVMGDGRWKGLSLRPIEHDLLPDFGGSDNEADEGVPSDYSDQAN